MLPRTRYLLLLVLSLLILLISGAVAFDPAMIEVRRYALAIFIVSIIAAAGALALFVYQFFRPDRFPEFLHGRLDKRSIREEQGIKFALVSPPDKAVQGQLIRFFLVLENAFDQPRYFKFYFVFKSFMPGADKHFTSVSPEMEVEGGEADLIVIPVSASDQAPPKKYSLSIDATAKLIEGYGNRMRTREGKSSRKVGIVPIIASLIIGPLSLLIPSRRRQQTSLEIIAKDDVEGLSSANLFPQPPVDLNELSNVERHQLWSPEDSASGDLEEIERFWGKVNQIIEDKNSGK